MPSDLQVYILALLALVNPILPSSFSEPQTLCASAEGFLQFPGNLSPLPFYPLEQDDTLLQGRGNDIYTKTRPGRYNKIANEHVTLYSYFSIASCEQIMETIRIGHRIFPSWLKSIFGWLADTLTLSLITITTLTRLLINRYIDALESSPMITKSITAGVVGGLGDAMSQIFERLLLPTSSNESTKKKKVYDYHRTLSILAEGIFISGPIMHSSYDFMEAMIPISSSGGLQEWIATGIHVAIDTFFIDSFFVLSMIVTTGIFEGQSLSEQVVPQLTTDFLPALTAAWATSFMMCPVQLLCFRFLPVSLRVLAMNVQDIFWNAIVSYMAHKGRKQEFKNNCTRIT